MLLTSSDRLPSLGNLSGKIRVPDLLLPLLWLAGSLRAVSVTPIVLWLATNKALHLERTAASSREMHKIEGSVTLTVHIIEWPARSDKSPFVILVSVWKAAVIQDPWNHDGSSEKLAGKMNKIIHYNCRCFCVSSSWCPNYTEKPVYISCVWFCGTVCMIELNSINKLDIIYKKTILVNH